MSKKLLLSLILFNTAFAYQDDRTLIKIPFEKREKLLHGMRVNLQVIQEILEALSNKNYKKIESSANEILLDEDRLSRIAEKQNKTFAELAVSFHGKGVASIISAARSHNDKEILIKLSQFVGSCNTCHQEYKVVEWPTKDYPEPKLLPLTMPKIQISPSK